MTNKLGWFVEDLQDFTCYRLNKLKDIFMDLHENTNGPNKVEKETISKTQKIKYNIKK